MGPFLKEGCAFAFQSCPPVPLLDLPARLPSSHSPLQCFLLSNRRVPLPLSSGPKAPLRPPAPVAMEMDSEVSKGSPLGISVTRVLQGQQSKSKQHGITLQLQVLRFQRDDLVFLPWCVNGLCSWGGAPSQSKMGQSRLWVALQDHRINCGRATHALQRHLDLPDICFPQGHATVP